MGIFVSSWLGVLYVYSVVLVLFIEAKMTLEDQGRMGVSFSITKVKIDKNGLIFYMPFLVNFDVSNSSETFVPIFTKKISGFKSHDF